MSDRVRRGAYAVVVAASVWLIAVVSRPGSTVWTWATTWMVVAGIVLTVLLAVGAATWREIEWRTLAKIIGIFVLANVLMLPAETVAMRVFGDQFESFAERARHEGPPDRESFRVGPYRYDRVCATDDEVFVWHSGDDLLTVRAVVIDDDGNLSTRYLNEGSNIFVCAADGR